MHRNRDVRLHELDRAHGILDAHGEIVADRHQHHVDPSFEQLHLHRQRGIAGMVDGLSADGQDQSARRGRVRAVVAGHRAAVKRRHELHLAPWELVRAPDVHPMHRGPLGGAEFGQLVSRDDGRPVLLGDRNGIPEMIAVAVREQDGVDLGKLVRSEVGCGVAAEEGVDQDATAIRLDQETGVAVKGQGQHASFPDMLRIPSGVHQRGDLAGAGHAQLDHPSGAVGIAIH